MTFSAKSIIVAALLCGLTACGGDENNSEIIFDAVSVSREVALDKSPDSPLCKVGINLKCAKGDDKAKADSVNMALAKWLFNTEDMTLKQAADSFANEYTRGYTETLAKLYREDKAYPDRRAWYQYSYKIDTEVRQGRKDVTVYIATVDYYEGGAHGIMQKLVTNFDSKTGRTLTLADVFVPGYEPHLREILLSELEEKAGAKDLDDLHAQGYLYSMDMFVPANFIIGEDGVTFIYNMYEIAPYEKGMTELTVDYSDLTDLLPR